MVSQSMTISYTSDKEELSSSENEYPIGTFAQTECLDETELSGGISELICTEEGEWDGQLGSCEKVEMITKKSTSVFTQRTTTERYADIERTPEYIHPSSSHIATTTESVTLSSFIDIPERFWVELRNYLFHGCQASTYQSVLCKVTSRHRYSDISLKLPKVKIPKIENDAMRVLRTLSKDKQLNSLTLHTFYDRLILAQGDSIPEDTFRQFLSFSIDSIIWNHSSLEEFLQTNGEGVTGLLINIFTPVFRNFQLNYDYQELFSSIATPTSTEDQRPPETTTNLQRLCPLSELPQLVNGQHEMIDGQVVYRCLDTYKMNGDGFVVTCGDNGKWEVIKRGSCRKGCGLLQMPEIMRPQGE